MTTTMRELYPQVEQAVRPIILAHAKKISAALRIPMDDAIQECALALYKGLQGYDYNRSHGGIHRYANTVLRNSAASIIVGNTTTARVPHVVYREDGELKVAKKRALASLDELVPSTGWPSIQPAHPGGTPEDASIGREIDQRRAKLKMRLVNKLTDRERAIFNCLTQPTEAFLIFMRNIGAQEPTHTVIARFLGISKNGVDYGAYNIRSKFTRLAEIEFPDLIEGHLERGTWPMIHISRTGKPDHEFAASVIAARGLDPRPNDPARDIDVAGGWAREVQNYPWGVVLILRKKDAYRTLVIEGRFNRLSGGVAGTDGTWKNVSDVVPWYPKLVRELNK